MTKMMTWCACEAPLYPPCPEGSEISCIMLQFHHLHRVVLTQPLHTSASPKSVNMLDLTHVDAVSKLQSLLALGLYSAMQASLSC